jgi:predicted ATPase/DNA-binding SARP family transcriptional activator
MEFRILGSFEVMGATGPLDLRGAKRRGLLACLLVHAGQALSTDRLVEELWGASRSAGATRTVQTYISQLRKLLRRETARLETRPGGYMLDIDPSDVDAYRFEQAINTAGAEPDPARKLAALDGALTLWRGTPLGEFAGAGWADREATRLETRHLQALHYRYDALMALDRAQEAAGELELLLNAHPLDERLWAQLMLALYHSGRQADALSAYQQARRHLINELGIEPGPQLTEVEHRILNHDPTLAMGADVSSAVGTATAAAERDGPSGVVTFLLTDIEGSTKLARALGDAYAGLIGRHNELLEAVWYARGGYVFGTRGDSFLVAFSDPDAAVLAAVDAQRRITAERWPGERPVRIRIGLHAGYARCVDGDYQALSINQASRVVDCAHGGQTFATESLVALLSARVGDIKLVPLGRYRVRDFDGPVPLHSVLAAGVPDVDRAPRVRPAEGHNIVRPTTVLVGREAEVASVVARLRPRTLATVVGPGGVGKTRLAVEAAMRAIPDWPDGVWFVDLTSVMSADDAPSAVALALGASIAPGEDVWREVLSHLENRDALVVLDNCEHVAEGVASLVHDLLVHCPGVGVLATSRTPLGLVEEHVDRLGPLAVETEQDPGVRLFLLRAAGAADRFHGNDVVALCRELDGLPLAIELAAARTTAISPVEILARLRSEAAVLHSRDPGRPERQRSLGRSLDWSYGLLDPPARGVYRRLSVFASSFDLAAAEQVCAVDGDGGEVAVDDVAELVWALVDASLVESDVAAGATRYRMLSVVRAHARSLAAGEEMSAAMRRLARVELDRIGPEHPIDLAWRSTMSVELDNVRAIVVTLGASQDAEELAIAQTLMWSVGRYHDGTDAFRAGTREVRRWTEALIVPTPERAALLTLLAELHLRLGETTAAAEVLDEAAALAVDVGLPAWDETGLDRQLGELALRRGELDRAITLGRAGLGRARTPRGRARLLNLLGIAFGETGDYAAAAEVIREEIDAARQAGMETYLVMSYGNLAEVLLRDGDAAGAAASQLDCLELSRSSGRGVPRAFSMILAAHLSATSGDWRRAVSLQSAADAELEHAEWALYGADASQRRQLLDDARRELGPDGFAAATAAGRALQIDEAADIAAAELRRIAARREEWV